MCFGFWGFGCLFGWVVFCLVVVGGVLVGLLVVWSEWVWFMNCCWLVFVYLLARLLV